MDMESEVMEMHKLRDPSILGTWKEAYADP
jgi:hypothetical protein